MSFVFPGSRRFVGFSIVSHPSGCFIKAGLPSANTPYKKNVMISHVKDKPMQCATANGITIVKVNSFSF